MERTAVFVGRLVGTNICSPWDLLTLQVSALAPVEEKLTSQVALDQARAWRETKRDAVNCQQSTQEIERVRAQVLD